MLDTGEVGEGPVVESSVELAVHKAAGRVEVFPGPVVATGARGAQETDKTRREVRAGGAQETDKTRREVRAGGARKIFYLKQKKLLKKEARLSSMKPSPN